jgi:septum formation protein
VRPLVLASSSPRRAEILHAAGLPFVVHAAVVDETRAGDEPPEAYVRRLALAKATAMLRRLGGRSHAVLTGVALVRDGAAVAQEVAATRVTFAPLSDAEIAWYAATPEPYDKAGGYAIQGLASRFVTGVDGSYANVVGLPVELVYRLLREAGSDPLA